MPRPARPLVRAFHGTPRPFTRFDLAFVGHGHDQEGPGFYFTSCVQDAATYCGASPEGVVLAVQLELTRGVPTDRPPQRAEVEALIRCAPERDARLLDWDDRPDVALRRAIQATMQHPSAHEAFCAIAADFYRDHASAFCRALVALGYDHVRLARTADIEHVVVYRPAAITIERALTPGEAGARAVAASTPAERRRRVAGR